MGRVANKEDRSRHGRTDTGVKRSFICRQTAWEEGGSIPPAGSGRPVPVRLRLIRPPLHVLCGHGTKIMNGCSGGLKKKQLKLP
jgi:hypothetical protein